MRKLLNVGIAVISLMFLSSSVAAAEVDTSNSTQVAQLSFLDQAQDKLGYFVSTIVHPIADPKDLECLAKNIYYESGSEPVEGKIAVGMVTINRSNDNRFPSSICGVVKQRTETSVPKTITRTYMVKTGYFTNEERTETNTIYSKVVICQFSWYCSKVPIPKENDPLWIESKLIANELLTGGYEKYHPQYGNLKFFHNTYVRPAWHGLQRIVKIGGHIFYASKE